MPKVQPMTNDPQALLARAKAATAGQQMKPQVKPMRTPPIMDPNQKPGGATQSGRMIQPTGKLPLNPAISVRQPMGGSQGGMPAGGSPPTVNMPPGGAPTMGTKPLALAGGGGQSPPIVNLPGNAPQFGTPGQHLGVQQPGQGMDQQQQGGGQPAWQQLQGMGIAGQGSAAANQAMLQQHQQGADPMAAVSAALQARSQMQGQQGQPGQMPPTGMHPTNPDSQGGYMGQSGMQLSPMPGFQGMPPPGGGGGGFQGGGGQGGPPGGWQSVAGQGGQMGPPPGAGQMGQQLSQIYGKPGGMGQPSVSYAPGGMQGQPGQMPTGQLPPTQPPVRPGGMGGLAQRPFTPQ